MLFFIALATRRIEFVACTSRPDGAWVTQQARNFVMQLRDEQPFRLLIHDRDSKFSHAFDEVFRSDGFDVIRTPIQAPNANAYAERWVRTVRAPPTASTGSSSSAAVTSSTCSASTAGITTSTGRTARSASCHPTAAIRPSPNEPTQSRTRGAATCSAE